MIKFDLTRPKLRYTAVSEALRLLYDDPIDRLPHREWVEYHLIVKYERAASLRLKLRKLDLERKALTSMPILQDLVYKHNPLLALLPKEIAGGGVYMAVPFKWGIDE